MLPPDRTPVAGSTDPLTQHGGALPRLPGGYQLLERVGESSGQGTVYRAWQASCAREVYSTATVPPALGPDLTASD